MENRRTIRNWDAFGRLERLANQFAATELFEPVFKLFISSCSALLLGVSFVAQSLSVVVALDVVLIAMFQSARAQLSKAFSIFVFFTPNAAERTATINGFVQFISNILWVRVAYKNHADCWKYMSIGPLLVVALMQAMVAFYTERLNTDQRPLNQGLYSVFLFTLFLLVFNLVTHSPDHILLDVVLLLRAPIDALCSSVDTIFKVCDNTLAGEDSGVALPVYTTQIARYAFWSSVHLLLVLISLYEPPASTTAGLRSQKADRFPYLLLFLHDLYDLCVPLRQLARHIQHERFVAKTFPRLTPEELAAAAVEPCSVCLCEHNTHTVKLRCGHLLHSACLQRILEQAAAGDSLHPAPPRCPMCRSAIEVPPQPSRRRGLFGPGSRGTVGVGGMALPLLGQVAGLQQGNGRRMNGVAQALIAQQLEQHNLQNGDVIQITIIPRSLVRASAAAAQNAPTGTTASTTANGAAPDIGQAGQAMDATGARQAPSPVPAAGASTAFAPAAPGTTASTTLRRRAPALRRVPSQAVAEPAREPSALQGIHGSSLYSRGPSAAPSRNTSTAALAAGGEAFRQFLHAPAAAGAISSSSGSEQRGSTQAAGWAGTGTQTDGEPAVEQSETEAAAAMDVCLEELLQAIANDDFAQEGPAGETPLRDGMEAEDAGMQQDGQDSQDQGSVALSSVTSTAHSSSSTAATDTVEEQEQPVEDGSAGDIQESGSSITAGEGNKQHRVRKRQREVASAEESQERPVAKSHSEGQPAGPAKKVPRLRHDPEQEVQMDQASGGSK